MPRCGPAAASRTCWPTSGPSATTCPSPTRTRSPRTTTSMAGDAGEPGRDASAGPRRDGFAVVDKAAGWTSHDVVAKARGILRNRKIGHSGTLDPDATGLLLLGVGRGTRLLRYLTAL